jgi:hypothetical protein
MEDAPLMSSEEMRRTIEFILNQQAQFVANQQELQETQTRATQLVLHLTEVLREVVDEQARTRARQEDTEARLTELRAHADERFAALADSIAHTDQKLDALIDIVRAERNGKA